MSFPELLDAINRLTEEEQLQLRLLLDQRIAGPAAAPARPANAPTEEGYLQQLAATGRLCQLPAQAATSLPAPVVLSGRPLSETLVEDRR